MVIKLRRVLKFVFLTFSCHTVEGMKEITISNSLMQGKQGSVMYEEGLRDV